MLNKQEFTNWINIILNFQKRLKALEDAFGNFSSIFDTELGILYDTFIDFPNFSPEAKDLIFDYCYSLGGNNKNEDGFLIDIWGSVIPAQDIDELYTEAIVLSYKEIIKGTIDYYLSYPNSEFRYHLEKAIIWDETLDDEGTYKLFENNEEVEKFINELNEYLKENYPNEKAHIFYNGELIMLVNDNNDVNKDLYDGMPEWEVLDYFFGGDHLNTLEYK